MTASSTPKLTRRPASVGQEGGPLHVVLVDEELPYPANSGKRIRTLNLALRLAGRHRLTYVCHRNADPEEVRRATAYLAGEGIETVVVDRPVPPKSGPRFYARLAANLFSPLPYSVTTHTSAALVEALRRVAATAPVDLWHCEWTPYAAPLRGVPGPRIVIAHNVESVIWRRYEQTEPGLLKRWYIRRQRLKWERFEAQALVQAERVVAVSDLDAKRLRQDFAVRRVDVVENGVDTAYFHPQGAQRVAGRLLFLGSLDWRPNLDAVVQLLDHVLPAARAKEPTAHLCLVGRNPPDWLRRRALQTPGVELHASVPDVRPYLAQCAAMLVPLRVGGGSRLKVLEALAMATPVVSTRIGAEGLHLQAGRDLCVVEDIGAMTEAVLATLRDPQGAQEQVGRGRAVVLRRYDWGPIARRMEKVWYDCVAGRDAG